VYRDRRSATAPLSPATVAVVAGRPSRAGAPLNQPPVFASAFGAGEAPGYARESNPTWEAFERTLGELEGGESVAFASGMAGATAVIDSLADGAKIAVARSAYLEVRRLLSERAGRGRLRVDEIDPLDTETAIAAARRADLVWLDALANPSLDMPELDRILPAADAAGTTAVVDATLVTPILLRPLELGASVVVHSATKAIGGHSDLMLGAAVARDGGVAARLREARTAAGAVPGTMEAWLALRGIRTLPLRIERGTASAAVLAERLRRHPEGSAVRYPGLAGDPANATAARLLRGFGAVVSFEVAGAASADAVCAAVEVITHASSLGGVETVIERQSRWHAEPSVPNGLLRLSVGCEDPEDLWRDLEHALAVLR
jgi:cystathionine gamma-synthase